MWREKYARYWGTEWNNAMKETDNFRAEIRSAEAVIQCTEQNIPSFEQTMEQDLARVTQALRCIRRRGFLRERDSALDIGSGTGAFTLPLAKLYRRVTALDISHGMLEAVKQKILAKNLTNVHFLQSDWHKLDLLEQCMAESYDLVLASLNPRGLSDAETLLKMSGASKGACCLIAFTGVNRKKHSAALDQIVLGRQLKSAGGNDIIMPFNLIYNWGGQPDLNYTSVAWERKFTPAQAVQALCAHYWRFAQITGEAEAKITDYVANHLEPDGNFQESAELPLAVMIWDARALRARLGQ
jgi:SAM-dependent methyltransferase